jgi:hypothetical protein
LQHFEQLQKDEASTEAAAASASLAAAEVRILSLREELKAAHVASEKEKSALQARLLQQQQQTLLAEADAVDARAAQVVEKLTDERNTLQMRQQMLQELHQQLQLQHKEQEQLLQAERDKISEQSVEILRMQKELSDARDESVKLLAVQVRISSRMTELIYPLIFLQEQQQLLHLLAQLVLLLMLVQLEHL